MGYVSLPSLSEAQLFMFSLFQLGHRDDIRSLAVSSNGSSCVSGGGNTVGNLLKSGVTVSSPLQLIVWDMHTLRPVCSLKEEGMEEVTAVVYATGDGHVVAGTKVRECGE